MKWSLQEVGLQKFLKELTKIFVKTIDKESCQCYTKVTKIVVKMQMVIVIWKGELCHYITG